MKRISVFRILIAVVLAACTPATPSEIGENDIQTAMAKTKEAEGSIQTMVAQTVAAITPSVTPTATETPIPTATNTPEPPASVTLLQNANCRGGPGSVYPIIVVTMQGENFLIDGQNDDQSWWRVLPPDKNPCWLPTEAVALIGKTNSIAVLPAPPTPTAGPVGTSLYIRYGQTVTGTMTSAKVQYWAFWGTYGDVVTIQFTSKLNPPASATIDLHYPSIGSSLAVPALCYVLVATGTYQCPPILDYVLTNTGYHYIKVYSSTEGSYSLSLKKR